MIAIAESGSTKCEWVILNDEGLVESNFKTQGFNPDFHSTEYVANTLSQCVDLFASKDKINNVYFYGASCSSPKLKKRIVDGLAQVFRNAEIVVDHDLLAAAYSLYEGEPLISCIIGTGSNSCYFDGENLTEKVPALGFVMGDEAGGGYFGKQLLSDFFYKRLPKSIQDDFEATYHLTWGEAREKIYGNIHANVYLASFMPFIAKHKQEKYIIDLLSHGFAKFIDIHVGCFSENKSKQVGFVGSLAFIFKDILIDELKKQGYKAGKIIKSPINELVNYHRNYLNILSDAKGKKIRSTEGTEA
ncbi:MAG: N-acetylglucosamine kinase-like BadF-type ATPase [Vicingaceae bacterium]|jgi:N-acetylglucosamine kinase-like BadF-type ATPase